MTCKVTRVSIDICLIRSIDFARVVAIVSINDVIDSCNIAGEKVAFVANTSASQPPNQLRQELATVAGRIPENTSTAKHSHFSILMQI